MISIKGADMRKLLRATHIKSIVDGSLDMDGHVSGHDDSINGTLTISARDGEIRKYELVSQIFSLLNVYKIFQNRDIDFISNHFTYNHMTSTLNITDNVVSFDDFALDSNSIQLSLVGKYSLKTKKIDANIGVQPLESVDWTVSKIPIVGWVLTGDKGKLIVVNVAQGYHVCPEGTAGTHRDLVQHGSGISAEVSEAPCPPHQRVAQVPGEKGTVKNPLRAGSKPASAR